EESVSDISPEVVQQGWIAWSGEKAKTVGGYALMPISLAGQVLQYGASGAVASAGFSWDVIQNKMAQKLTLVNDAQSFNKALVDMAKEAIRGQAFDAMAALASELYTIEQMLERCQSHTDENLAVKYGFSDTDA